MDTLLHSLNYWTILIAAAAYWIFGAIWFSSFGSIWKKEMEKIGIKIKKPNTSQMWIKYGVSYLLNIIGTFGLAIWIKSFHLTAIGCAVRSGLFIGICFVGVSMAASYVWENRSLKLCAINIGYPVIGMVISAIVLVLLP